MRSTLEHPLYSNPKSNCTACLAQRQLFLAQSGKEAIFSQISQEAHRNDTVKYSYGEQKASTFHDMADLACFILHLPKTLSTCTNYPITIKA